MKFTIVFPSTESSDISIGAVFKPCLVWVEGENELLNPHPDDPDYKEGDLITMLQKTNLRSRLSDHTKMVTIVVHSIGHGIQDHLTLLQTDLINEGFEVQTVFQ